MSKLQFYEPGYIVTFVDWDATVLKVEVVSPSGNATPPENPTRVDYVFTSWSGDYTGVTTNRTITATYVYDPSLYLFTSHTFTTCGVTGRYGPTFPEMKTEYSGEVWVNNLAWFNLGFYQGYQLWTVPKNGTYKIEVEGASGGAKAGASNSYQGHGAHVEAEFVLTKGDILKIVVGDVGLDGSLGGGGGGGSFVGPSIGNNPLLVAGGGAGSYNASNQLSISDASLGVLAKTGQAVAPEGAGGGGGWVTNGVDSSYSNSSGGQSFANGLIGGETGSVGNAGTGGFGGGGGAEWNYYGSSGGGGGYSGGSDRGVTNGGNTSGNTQGGGSCYLSGSNQVSSLLETYGPGSVTITLL